MAKAKPHDWRKWNEFRIDAYQELNEGPAYEYADHVKKIDKLYDAYWDAVKDFEKLLNSKGLKKEAHNLHSFYTKFVVRFHQFFEKFVSKLM
jgi:hypothetical protein